MQKLTHITDEQWARVCQFNKDLLDEFIDVNAELSQKTLNAYYSNLRIWFVWVMENLGNKRQVDVRPLDFKKYQNWLLKRGASSADVNNKRAAVSSLNNHIRTMVSYAIS